MSLVQTVLCREPAVLETLGKRDVAAVRGENLPDQRHLKAQRARTCSSMSLRFSIASCKMCSALPPGK